MSLDAAILSMLDDVHRNTFGQRSVVYVPSSRTLTIRRNCVAVFRCLGSGGSGGVGFARANASAAYNGANGGNGGTVALKVARLLAGQTVSVQIAAGGTGVTGSTSSKRAGNDGGALIVTAPGVSINIPGGRGGATPSTDTDNPPNADPSGVDWFSLGGLGGRDTGGGGSAALLWGVSAQRGGNGSSRLDTKLGAGGGAGVGGAGGSAVPVSGGIGLLPPGAGGGAGSDAWVSNGRSIPGTNLAGVAGVGSAGPDPAHSLILLDVSAGGGWTGGSDLNARNGRGGGGGGAGAAGSSNSTDGTAGHGGFGGGGGGGAGFAHGSTVWRAQPGNGGMGGGGGALLAADSYSVSGYGGNAFLTLELLEY